VAEARAAGAILSPGVGPGAERLIRLDHTGHNAVVPRVLGTVLAYGAALHRRGVKVDLAAASAGILGA
jgi:aspartate aminotransferase-like enzyme